MVSFRNETKKNIRNCYDEMTAVEKNIAEFFLSNTEKCDLSSKNIAKHLYVSEASLSRFAKKCGYKGYRELIFLYEKDLEYEKSDIPTGKDISYVTKKNYGYYKSIIHDDYELIDEEQIQRVAGLLDTCRRVFICGLGCSGLAAREMQLRLMRAGVDVDVVTDPHIMMMRAALVDSECLVIGISLSGKTKEVLDCLQMAKKSKAKVVLITSHVEPGVEYYCDDILRVAYVKNLDFGMKVSPQLSILIMFDILYAYYMEREASAKIQKYKNTLSALREK